MPNPYPWHFRRSRNRVEILADNPEQEVWFLLSEDESEYAVKRKLSRYLQTEGIEIDDEELSQAVSYFSYCLKQAKEYFNAAKNVSILTRPLLLFYGMVCLAKVLIILKEPRYPLEVRKSRNLQQHGLTFFDKRSDDILLENDIVQIKSEGTFSSVYRFFKEELPEQKEYSIGDLYGWIHELYTYFPIESNLRTHLAMVNNSIDAANGHIVLKIRVVNWDQFEEKSIYEVYPFLKEDFDLREEDGSKVFVGKIDANKKKYPKEIRDSFERKAKQEELVKEIEKYLGEFCRYDLLTREYLVPRGEQFKLNPLLATYMLMYGYSRVCRYQPQKWGQVIEGRTSNERWLVEKAVELSAKIFPLEIYSIFRGKSIIISNP